jgi:O-acetyl-ADP-ribose deacetylase (regulator of RNase III)
MTVIVVDQANLYDNKILRLVKGDITERDVDVIVNAANSYLKHSGGVAAAIVRKGGQVIQEESDKIGFVPVGSAVITTAGKLPCKAVIHTVGPRMGEADEDNKLGKAVRSSLTLASKKGFMNIAMPAISSGIFGFPKDKCAKILVEESKRFLKQNNSNICSIDIIEFCIFDNETLDCFKTEFANVKNIK